MNIKTPSHPISIELENGEDTLSIKCLGKIAEWAIRSGKFEETWSQNSLDRTVHPWEERTFHGIKLGDLHDLAKRLEKL